MPVSSGSHRCWKPWRQGPKLSASRPHSIATPLLFYFYLLTFIRTQCNKTHFHDSQWQWVLEAHLICSAPAQGPPRRAFQKHSVNIMLKSSLKEGKQRIFLILISTLCHSFPHFIQSWRLFWQRSRYLQCLCTLYGNIFLSLLQLSHHPFWYFGPFKAVMENPGSSWATSQMQMLCRFPQIPRSRKNQLFAVFPFKDTARISSY